MEVKKIYLDMDGVLADFDKGVWKLCGMKTLPQNGKRDPHHDDLMWEAIRKVDHFYDKLKLMPGARDMFNEIWNQYGDRCEVLTGIPRPERNLVTAAEDKIHWMHRVLNPDIKVNAVCRKHKLDFCTGPETILIDDREKTIREWQEKGGTAILHESADKTVDILRDMGILHYSPSLDESPRWPDKPFRRGERATEMFLRIGWITEEDIEDD